MCSNDGGKFRFVVHYGLVDPRVVTLVFYDCPGSLGSDQLPVRQDLELTHDLNVLLGLLVG